MRYQDLSVSLLFATLHCAVGQYQTFFKICMKFLLSVGLEHQNTMDPSSAGTSISPTNTYCQIQQRPFIEGMQFCFW